MAEFFSFSLHKREDATVTIPLTPPTNIQGWGMEFFLSYRFGSTSGRIVKSMASGFYGVSGMDVENALEGIFNVSVNGIETSGLDAGNYAYTIRRTNSGYVSDVTQGYLSLLE